MKLTLKFHGAEMPSDSEYGGYSCSADNEGDDGIGVVVCDLFGRLPKADRMPFLNVLPGWGERAGERVYGGEWGGRELGE